MDKLAVTKGLIDGDVSDARVNAFLEKAKEVILRRLDPLGVVNPSDVPDIYAMLQCELAVRYYYRMGGEGEMSHGENGVNRTYGSVNDEDLLREIMPYVKVV